MKFLKLNIAIVFIVSMLSGILFGQNVNVPIDVQVSLLPKVLSMNKSFDGNQNNINVGILFNSSIRNSVWIKNNIIEDYKNNTGFSSELKIEFTLIDISSTENIKSVISSNNIKAIYITPIRAFDINKITQICRTEKIISITSVAQYLDYGVSVGFDLINNKLKISINLESAKEEGANFSSHLLKLAHIIN